MENIMRKTTIFKSIAVSALSSVFGFTGAYAEAKAPSLKIGGNTIMNVYIADQKIKNNGKKSAPHFANDISDLYFLISGQTTSGIEYKYKINFQAYSNAHPVVNQNYIEFNTKLGTVQFGNVVGPEDSMIQDAGAITSGIGAFDGAFYKVFNLSALSPRGNDNIGDSGYATKIVYYSPELMNFRLGIAYTPSSAHLGEHHQDHNSVNKNGHVPGQRTFFPKTSNPKGINAIGLDSWIFGLSFNKTVGNFGINLNGAYIMDRSYLVSTNSTVHKLRLHNTNAYQLGLVLGYRLDNGYLIQVAGGYLNNNKSRLMKQPLGASASNYGFAANGDGNLSKGNSGQAWNVGSAITMGAYKVSVAYQETWRKTDATNEARNQVASIAGEVVPVAGLKFYTEVDYIRSRSNLPAVALAQKNMGAGNLKDVPNRRNQGVVIAVGSKISF